MAVTPRRCPFDQPGILFFTSRAPGCLEANYQPFKPRAETIGPKKGVGRRDERPDGLLFPPEHLQKQQVACQIYRQSDLDAREPLRVIHCDHAMPFTTMKSSSVFLATLIGLASAPLNAQVIFANPALFQENNGVITQLNTGLGEHNFPSISRDSRFVVFASPDPVTVALQVPPSSDVYAFDRVLGRTRKIIDTNTNVASPSEVQVFRPVSPAFSPNNQFLAYGLELARRSGNSPNGSGRTLIVADANTGLQIDEPTSPRGGAVDDSFALEFTGISWDPGGLSFVPPTLVPAASDGLGGNLHAIVRYTRDPATGRWPATAQLSTPRFTYNNGLGGFRPSAQLQVFPAISPSGAGLAYFI